MFDPFWRPLWFLYMVEPDHIFFARPIESISNKPDPAGAPISLSSSALFWLPSSKPYWLSNWLLGCCMLAFFCRSRLAFSSSLNSFGRLSASFAILWLVLFKQATVETGIDVFIFREHLAFLRAALPEASFFVKSSRFSASVRAKVMKGYCCLGVSSSQRFLMALF